MKVYILTYDGLVNKTVELYDYLQPKYWPTADITILGYKPPTYKSDTIKFDSLGEDTGHTGVPNRLYDYFSKLEDRHFIFGVDDSPFISTVDINLLKVVEEFLNHNDHVGRFAVTLDEIPRPTQIIKDMKINEHIINWHESVGNLYKLSGTWSIWNREYFLKYINKFDNLWQWETAGSSAAVGDGYIVLSTNPAILTHAHLIKRGQFRDEWQHEAVNNQYRMSEEVETKIKQIFKLDDK